MSELKRGQFIKLNVSGEEINAHYHELGERGKDTIVFVQTGGTATCAYMCWYQNLEAFASAGYHILAPDSVGFGLTEKVSAASEKGGVSAPMFLTSFMDTMDIERAHFIGNSAGSMAITRLAIEFPQRVKSLILTGGEPRIETDQSQAIARTLGQTERMNHVRTMLNKPQVCFEDICKATADFFYDPGHQSITEVAKMRLQILQRPGVLEKEREHAFRQIGRGRSNIGPSDLARIQAPVYLIHGRDERFFYPKEISPILLDCAIKAAFVIPHCSCTVLSHCGHWPQIEKAHSFNALSLEFFASL